MDDITIMNDVKKFIENNIIAPGATIETHTELQDAGIDSFSIVEILLFIERKYGVVIPNEKLVPDNFKSIYAVAQTVKEYL